MDLGEWDIREASPGSDGERRTFSILRRPADLSHARWRLSQRNL